MFSHFSPRAVAGVALAVVACGGTTDPIASFETVTYKSSVYALNGTPIGVPNALNTLTAATVRADATYDFDVAFDLDAQNRPVLLTQRVVGRPLGLNGHAVGLQIVSTPFDLIVEAPRDGWVTDSVLTVPVGQVVVIRAQPSTCQFNVGAHIHSKMVIDSVNVAARRLWLTTLSDPNCGFRGLTEGRPRR